MSEKKLSLSEVIAMFQKKLARFLKASSKTRVEPVRQDAVLQQQINEKESRYELSVINNYTNYRIPFETLGKDSIRAKSIDEDEQNLLKAYNLFKDIQQVIDSHKDEKTYISHFEIESPIAKKDMYTAGNMFAYLQMWLKFEQHAEDFIPVLEMKKNGSFRLVFQPSKSYRLPAAEREMLEIVRSKLYS